MLHFLDILQSRHQHQSELIAYRFFKGGQVVQEISYTQLWQQATFLASQLQARNLQGQCALLVCKESPHFIIAFWACLLAGAIAVPTAVPRRQNLQSRLNLLIDDAEVKAILCDHDDMLDADWQRDGQAIPRFDLRVTGEGCAGFAVPNIDADTLAFLQYTSGSTGDPKGVMVSHGNLMHNCAAIGKAMDISSASQILNALPLFHDMGLIGGVMQAVFSGATSNVMSPVEAVQYPERWLQTISRLGITHSGGPNFLYDLAARSVKPEQLDGVSLASWRVAFCGAEPVRVATVQRFCQHFAAHGFAATAFFPCYGMAESTLFITGKTDIHALPASTPREGLELTICGTPQADVRLAIVDPDTCQAVPPGCTGEIWTSSPSVAHGYWGRTELTEQCFGARIAGGDDTRYLRTGDLGFLKQGELVVTSRLKDLIIAYGKKYAPQDLEDEAERNQAALRPLASAAFAVHQPDKDKVVLVCELQRTWLRREAEWPDLIKSIRQAISHAHGLTLDEVVLILPGTLPRTSSGKVRRSQCRLDYLSGALARAGSPRSETLCDSVRT